MGQPWPDRVAASELPTTLFHATTPKKLARYRATGRILPPVRGFDSAAAAVEWGRTAGRSVIVEVTVVTDVWPLPDHHNSEGLAWWTLDGSEFRVLEERLMTPAYPMQEVYVRVAGEAVRRATLIEALLPLSAKTWQRLGTPAPDPK